MNDNLPGVLLRLTLYAFYCLVIAAFTNEAIGISVWLVALSIELLEMTKEQK